MVKERITGVELTPDGKLVKHKAIQQRSNRKPGRKPKRKDK